MWLAMRPQLLAPSSITPYQKGGRPWLRLTRGARVQRVGGFPWSAAFNSSYPAGDGAGVTAITFRTLYVATKRPRDALLPGNPGRGQFNVMPRTYLRADAVR